MTCQLANSYRSFRAAYCLPLQGVAVQEELDCYTLMEAARSSETSVIEAYYYRRHDVTSQKTWMFISIPVTKHISYTSSPSLFHVSLQQAPSFH